MQSMQSLRAVYEKWSKLLVGSKALVNQIEGMQSKDERRLGYIELNLYCTLLDEIVAIATVVQRDFKSRRVLHRVFASKVAETSIASTMASSLAPLFETGSLPGWELIEESDRQQYQPQGELDE